MKRRDLERRFRGCPCWPTGWIRDALEDWFGRRVDLLTESMINNPCFREDVEISRRVLLEL